MRNILIRATNWVGDAVMSAPAIRAVRDHHPEALITVLARPWVADIYAREPSISRVIRYDAPRGWRGAKVQRETARMLRGEGFDTAILLQNAFEAALIAWMARIPRRIGYDRDGRKWLLTDAVAVPQKGEIPEHERYYYLELLRRAGVIPDLPEVPSIRLGGAADAARDGTARLLAMGVPGPAIGVSPGAAFGSAKQWIPEHFAQAASRLSRDLNARVLLFGTAGERELCERIAGQVEGAVNLAGRTTLAEFIDLTAACRVFLTNDSGPMHIASALGVPTVAVFGATNHITTGPTGPLARVVREPVECSPCLLRECPIDHRCMTRVGPERVVDVVVELLRP